MLHACPLRQCLKDACRTMEFDASDSRFYDHEYFISMEYRYFSFAHRTRVRSIMSFIRDLSSKDVLDIGGGGGYFAHLMAERGARVFVVDYSEAAIDFGRLRFPDLEFLQLPVYELGTLRKHFDIVTCIDVIEHLDRPRVMLQEVHKVLKEDGAFYVATDNLSSPFVRISLLSSMDFRLRKWTKEGSDFDMIKRVERYRRYVIGKDYHKSHISPFAFEDLLESLDKVGWEIDAWRTYHLYDYAIKRALSKLMGPRSGSHMIFRCFSSENR